MRLAADPGRRDPRDPLATIGAVIAVADLEDVCSAAVHDGTCDCGPWAERGYHHWHLTAIRPSPAPSSPWAAPTSGSRTHLIER